MLLISMPDPMIGSEKTGYSHPTFGTTSIAAFGLEAIMGFLLTMVVLNVRRHETRRSSIMIGTLLCSSLATGDCCNRFE